ncbi:MAG TPA: F0F1 ATP synthase subunit A [Candidatus Fimivivens faecavium]|nr:F0F1 ATP synthase subunit A [Candidatus Fimivivens faecavium]
MNGPQILFVIPILGGIPVTETVRNSWIAMAVIFLVALWLASGLKKVPGRKQAVAELAVNTIYNLVGNTMGKDKLYFAPYMGTLFVFSLCSSLLSLFGFRPPTGDLNTTMCWALITFGMIQVFGVKSKGLYAKLHTLIEPMPLMFPLNFIGEFSNPVSMMFRHFGNIAAGIAITSLLYSGLAAASNILLGWFTSIPILQLGIPAILSVYFDLFTSCLQPYIFIMLTMVYVSNSME